MPRHYESTEVRKRQIADAALLVIAQEGLSRFTTRAIAAHLDITDGTLFRHFKNKAEIVLAAMDRLEEMMFDGMPEFGPDPVACLEAFFRGRASLVGVQGSIGRLIFSDQLPRMAGEAGEAKATEWLLRNLAFLAECVELIGQQDRLATDLSVLAIVQLIQGQILTFALVPTLPDLPLPPLDQRIDLAWGTLRHLIIK
jgi:AcrR family transcriptional regulator